MILIGQFDSPFVRRVGIALRLYDIAFEHRPWSVFGNADDIAGYNPMRRVPTLVLDDGFVVIESANILDLLDDMVGPERAMIARTGVERRDALKICALSTGLADKAVALIYDRVLHDAPSPVWTDRCSAQIAGVLNALEADRMARANPWWLGEEIGHADIAAACALRFLNDAHPGVFDVTRWPLLAAHSARCEGLAPFKEIQQAFSAPA